MSVSLINVRQHRWMNWLTTLLLIIAIALILMLSIHMFFSLSWVSSAITVFIAIAVAVFGPQVSPAVVLKMYKAKQVHAEHAPDLYNAFLELARLAELEHQPRLFYIPSQLPNAFAVGTASQASVAVTDGLLRGLNRRELLGVLAHEISHIRHRDLFLLGIADSLSRLTSLISRVGLLLAFLSLPLMVAGAAGYSLLGFIFLILAPTVSTLLQLALSRSREYDADVGAVSLTGDPEGLASALQKIEQMVKPSWWRQILMPGDSPEPNALRTHPVTKDRIARLMELKVRDESPTDPLHLPHPDIVFHPMDQPAPLPGTNPIETRPRWRISGLKY